MCDSFMVFRSHAGVTDTVVRGGNLNVGDANVADALPCALLRLSLDAARCLSARIMPRVSADSRSVILSTS